MTLLIGVHPRSMSVPVWFVHSAMVGVVWGCRQWMLSACYSIAAVVVYSLRWDTTPISLLLHSLLSTYSPPNPPSTSPSPTLPPSTPSILYTPSPSPFITTTFTSSGFIVIWISANGCARVRWVFVRMRWWWWVSICVGGIVIAAGLNK